MTLEERINQDLKEAMKSKDEVGLRTIRAIKAAILILKTDGSGDEINEEREIKLLQKMHKQRKESLTIYQQQNRPELAKTEEDEIAVIERYLPKAMDASELNAMIKSIIAETGASGPKDMGKVIGAAKERAAGKVDGQTLAAAVKQMLSELA